jgi:hypothetical protein
LLTPGGAHRPRTCKQHARGARARSATESGSAVCGER